MPGLFITQAPHLWQMKFLNASELGNFGHSRGLGKFDKSDITQLWQLGLIKADFIESKKKLTVPDLIYHGVDEYGNFIYSDERALPQPIDNWENATLELQKVDEDIELLFHPFRYYVLCQLDEKIGLHTSRMQMFRQKFYPQVLETCLSMFNYYSKSPLFSNQIKLWNDIATLSILIDPCIYVKIFKKINATNKNGIMDNGRQNYLDIEKYWKDEIKKLCIGIGKDQLEGIRQELCIATQKLDSNRWIHTLLCLGDPKLRVELEGRLGGALILRTMAEMIRRATERTFRVKLREEDELGFGMVFKNVKKQIYGSNRILDKNENVAREYLKQDAFFYGLSTRFYVEGDTEYYAALFCFQSIGTYYVEVINLKGEFVQKNGKGVAFRESLQSDIQLNLFSIVMLDGDREDNVRVVRKAAHDDEICGGFYISQPDFEFANFELSELEEIIWKWASKEDQSLTQEDRDLLHRAIKDVKSGEELMKNIKSFPEFNMVAKGADWGKKLSLYALQNPLKGGKKRQFIESIQMAIRTKNVSYQSTRKNYRVDESSGLLIKRKKK